jgi:HlyD family secretion protein
MTAVNVDNDTDIQKSLGLDKQASGRRRAIRWIAMAIGIAVIGAIVLFTGGTDKSAVQYSMAEAKQGTLIVTVTATGRLEPLNQVDVGSELSGTIKSVEVDFNDRVKRGQPLAHLDTEQLEARVVQGRASLKAAEAKLLDARATVLEARANLRRQERLAKQNLTSVENLDAARATNARAEAAVANANAQVALSGAALDADETNLRKAVISSPIDGIVLSRNVEPGQTVAASFQTPVLFTLAEDLRQMELLVDVDEADVGQVQPGQEATFTVDAYPNQYFPARVIRVHYAPKITQDVVTYEASLSVDNSNLLLRPGMTATADIAVKSLDDALLVPNAALRFTPPSSVKNSSGQRRGMLRVLFPGPPRTPPKERADKSTKEVSNRVWTLRNGEPVAIPVKVGASDGRMTEVLGGDIKAGTPLIVDLARSK